MVMGFFSQLQRSDYYKVLNGFDCPEDSIPHVDWSIVGDRDSVQEWLVTGQSEMVILKSVHVLG